jgi:hypothetical protein
MFIGTSLQDCRGYTPRHVLHRRRSPCPFAVVASMTIAVAVAVWVTVKRRSIAFGIVSVIWIATWLLVAKASFVRFDPIHEVIAPLWAATALPILWSATMMNDGSVGTNALMAVALLGSWGSTELALRHASRPALVSSVVGVPRRAFRSARSLANLRRARDREQANFDAMRRSEIARTPLPQIGGTVDAYPTDVSALLSHGFDYEPRPVLQSYAAYTPRLSALNAAHLRGSRAPENLLLDIAPIDARLASMEDGASWIEICDAIRWRPTPEASSGYDDARTRWRLPILGRSPPRPPRLASRSASARRGVAADVMASLRSATHSMVSTPNIVVESAGGLSPFYTRGS